MPKYFVQNKQQLATERERRKCTHKQNRTTPQMDYPLRVVPFTFFVILPLDRMFWDRDYLDQLCRRPRLPWTGIPGTEITGSQAKAPITCTQDHSGADSMQV